MKNFILFSSVCILFACNTPTEQKSVLDTATLKGKITNPTAKNFRLITKDSVYIVDLDSLNGFELVVNIDESEYMKFWHGPEYGKLYLKPGDDVSLELDASNFDESLIFSGKGAVENNYLIKKLLAFGIGNGNQGVLYALDKDVFLNKIDSINQSDNDFLTAFIASNKDISKDFITLEREKISFSKGRSITGYNSYQFFITKKDIKLSEAENKFLSSLNLNNQSYLKIDEFVPFVENYFYILGNFHYKDSTWLSQTMRLKNLYKLTLEKISNKKIKDAILFYSLSKSLKQSGIGGLEEILALFNKECTNKEYQTKINALYEKWSKLAKGQPAFEFKYLDIEGNEVALSDFKGKYVYIDVWATWCGPCKREIPFLTKVEEAFHDKNIVFMSISTDENKEAWKNMVKEKELKGIQLHAGRGTSISQDYIINSIPRFILIDSDGNIFNANAPRPSGGLTELLNSLDKIKHSI